MKIKNRGFLIIIFSLLLIRPDTLLAYNYYDTPTKIEPTIISYSKEVYEGAILEIFGKDFGEKGDVSLDGQSCTNVKWYSTYISCTVPGPSNLSKNSVSFMVQFPSNNYQKISISTTFLHSLSNDTMSFRQIYLKTAKITDIKNKYTGKGVVVAVIDSGVDINNHDLQSNLWINYGEQLNNKIDDDKNGYVDDFYGYNFVSNNADLLPSDSHGTMVAGIIAAKKDNALGIAGIAPDAKIMALKACSSYGCARQDVINAIRYAADNGANIINLSLSGDGSLGYSPEYDEVIKYAYDKNVLIVAAAGNGDTEGAGTRGQNMDSVKASPVCNEDNINYIIGVGAIDNNNDRTIWTNYSMKYVDVSAPGEDIFGLVVPLYDSGQSFAKESGTSFSAPIVVGVAALLKEENPQWKNYELMSQIISRSDEFKNGYNVYGRVLNAKNIIDNSYPITELDSLHPTVFDGSGKIKIYGKNFYREMKLQMSNNHRSGIVPQEIMTIHNNYVEIDLNKSDFFTTDTEKYSFTVTNGFVSDKQRLPNILEVKSLSKNNIDENKSNPAPVVENTNKQTFVAFVISDNTSVNIRKSASASANIVGNAKKKTRYELVDDTNQNWFKIKFGSDKAGWVMRKFFRIIKNTNNKSEEGGKETIAAEIPGLYVTSDNFNINIRQKPDSSSVIVGTILKKGKYEIIDNDNKYWIQVKFNSEKIGWVVRKLVRIINN